MADRDKAMRECLHTASISISKSGTHAWLVVDDLLDFMFFAIFTFDDCHRAQRSGKAGNVGGECSSTA